MKISSLLIANRGEIACRIIRTCKKLGIRTIALASEADRSSLHTTMADEVVYLPGAEPKSSYLLGDAIIEGALKSKAAAIHPGYGFLAENAEFAASVVNAGIIWIGPSSESMKASGSKTNAKKLAEKANVPIPPWRTLSESAIKEAEEFGKKHGYPVMIKAEAGGGGRGMRRVNDPSNLASSLESAAREAKAAFGNGNVFLEKLIENPRHVEVQILGDTFGSVTSLWDRDCSLQRNHQKVIEEAPAPNIPDTIRKEIHSAAVRLGEACGYVNAGTCEFLYDGKNFYFLEINSRLQVEHPVTESIYGIDLVELQIRVASGEKLPKIPSTPKGHAIEARICAEIPEEGFIASTGVIHEIAFPETSPSASIRIDTGVARGSRVSPYYDSLISKVVSYSDTREKALEGLKYALLGTRILGIKSNVSFLLRGLDSKEFREVRHHVSLANTLAGSLGDTQISRHLSVCASYFCGKKTLDSSFMFQISRGLSNYQVDGDKISISEAESGILHVTSEGESTSHRVNLVSVSQSSVVLRYSGTDIEFLCLTLGHGTWVSSSRGTFFVRRYVPPRLGKGEGSASDGIVKSPLPGKVVSVLTNLGAEVEEGAPLLVIESMKMEHIIRAPRQGVVEKIAVQEGAFIDGSIELLTLANQ